MCGSKGMSFELGSREAFGSGACVEGWRAEVWAPVLELYDTSKVELSSVFPVYSNFEDWDFSYRFTVSLICLYDCLKSPSLHVPVHPVAFCFVLPRWSDHLQQT